MTERFDCAQVQELAAELALGVAAGGERAEALRHLAGCAPCRALVAELADVADSVLGLSPEAEAPAGFETRVLARLGPARRRRRLLLPAAAAVIGLLIGSLSGWVLFRDRDSRLERAYVTALERLGGRALLAGTLEDLTGNDAGRVFLYEGDISWVFVAVQDPGVDATYSIEIRRARGAPVVVPGLLVSGGRGSMGTALDLPSLREVRGVAVIDGNGAPRYVGRFDLD